MALAKFLEDISDRYFEGRAAMDRLDATFAPGTYQPAPPIHTGWVRLALKQGPLPDRIALLEGDQAVFNVETDKPDVPFKIEFMAGPRPELPTVSVSSRSVSFILEHDGLYLLKLTCGAYYKEYEIDVTRTLNLDLEEPIQNGYLYLQDRPDEWTRERLDSLKRLMIPANRPAGVPDSFCNGILDYHLALFHAENENEVIANQRFEDAYKNLRPFIAHSDVAHFICDYILYMMNRFGGCDAVGSPGRFGGLRAFFRAPHDDALKSCRANKGTSSGRYIEVLVKSIDQKMLEVVSEICLGPNANLRNGLESLENRRVTGNYDVACQARLHVVLARGYRRLGDRQNANHHYKQLSQMDASSPWHLESNESLFQSK